MRRGEPAAAGEATCLARVRGDIGSCVESIVVMVFDGVERPLRVSTTHSEILRVSPVVVSLYSLTGLGT